MGYKPKSMDFYFGRNNRCIRIVSNEDEGFYIVTPTVEKNSTLVAKSIDAESEIPVIAFDKIFLVTNPVEIYTGLAFEQVLYLNCAYNNSMHQQYRSSQTMGVSNVPISTKSAVLSSTLPETLRTQTCLCMWRSEPAVVIGRNQNPLLESNIHYLQDNNIMLARRDSGGGTVYQDSNNLNICIIRNTLEYKVIENLTWMLGLLARMGYDCSIDEKQNIRYGRDKISGSAYRYGKDVQMHHFTLLLDTNLEALHMAIAPTHGLNIESVGIASNRTTVCNLGLTSENIMAQVQADVLSTSKNRIEYMGSRAEMRAYDARCFDNEYARLRTHEWMYHRTPRFGINLVLPRGEYLIAISRGKIKNIRDIKTGIEMPCDDIDIFSHRALSKARKKYARAQKTASNDIIEEVLLHLQQKIFGG